MRAIGFTSWFSSTMPLGTALRYLSLAHCADVEIAAMPSYLTRWREIGDRLKNRQMDVSAVSLGVPFFYGQGRLDLHSHKRDIRSESIRYVRDGIDFASHVGAKLIYACSMTKGPPREHGRTLQLLAESLIECSDHARSSGVAFGLEPYPTGELPTVRELCRFIREIDIGNLGVVFDTGHAAISKEPLSAAVRECSENLLHVHLNNNDGSGDLHWPPQTGVLTTADFSDAFRELLAIRYSGRISVELSRPRPVVAMVVESREFVKRMLDRVGYTQS